jgi:hypothetical protein
MSRVLYLFDQELWGSPWIKRAVPFLMETELVSRGGQWFEPLSVQRYRMGPEPTMPGGIVALRC